MSQENQIIYELQQIRRSFQLTKPVLNFREMVQFCGFSEQHARYLTSKKVIPHSKPTNGLVFYEREKLIDWLLSNPSQTDQEFYENFRIKHRKESNHGK